MPNLNAPASKPDASYSRERAIALKAASARDVLSDAGFAWLAPAISAGQWQQLQRYLDAAVLDQSVKQEVEALRRQGTRQYGNIVYTSPEAQRLIDKAKRGHVPAGKGDSRVRLDYKRLLSADALKPVTDSPDEADYLEQQARKALEDQGVWLQLAPKIVGGQSGWSFDVRRYQVWLTLGPSGDPIPVKKSCIDRAALLGNTAIGSGYYKNVHTGPIETMLEREIERLSREISSGRSHHAELRKLRTGALPGVAKVAELLGGASFPDIDMWEEPRKLVLRAMDLRTKGKVFGSRAMLVVAALATRNGARLLSQYVGKTAAGAAIGVKLLTVVEITCAVASAVLAVHFMGVAVARAGASRAGTAAADAALDALAEREVAKYVARNPEFATELNQVRVVAGPKGTVLGGAKGGHSAGYGGGFGSW